METTKPNLKQINKVDSKRINVCPGRYPKILGR